jgi:trehalose/maltose hydrolase-like predicted phosphorylase
MFLDLQEDKGFITKSKEVENYMLMLSMLDGMLTKTETASRRSGEMINIIDVKTRSWLMMI